MQLHGDYGVGRCGQVILFAGRGPWNDESLKDGTRRLGNAISSVDQTQPWVQFSFLVGESIMPPSAFEMFAYQTKIRKQKGLSALAIVIQDSDIANTIKHQLTTAYDAAEIEHRYFDDVHEAREWLNAKGYDLSQETLDDFLRDFQFLRSRGGTAL